MSCTISNSNINRKPKLTEYMKNNNQMYVWKSLKSNPDMYCWLPASKNTHLSQNNNLSIENINIQNIPPLMENKHDNIIEKLQENANNFLYKNNIDNFQNIYLIVKKFIIENEKILYDKKAISLLNNPKKDNKKLFFQFFSNNPWNDANNLSKLLYKNNFKNSYIKSSFRKGSYFVFYQNKVISEITFLSDENLLEIKTKKIQNFNVVTKHFLLSQIYKNLSNPLISNMWHKNNNKLSLINVTKKKVKCNKNIFITGKTNIKYLSIIKKCYNFFKKNELIFGGTIAYNTLIQYGGGKDRLKFDYFMVYSNDAFKHIQSLLSLLLESEENKFNTMSMFYPYKAINKQSYILTYNDDPICGIYQLDSCIPIKYLNNIYITGIDYLKYEFYIVMAYFNDDSFKHMECALKYLEQVQYNYYNKKKISEYDISPFQRFITKCIGDTSSSLLNDWIDFVEHNKKIQTIKPDKNTITLNNVKDKIIIIKPRNYTDNKKFFLE